MKINVFFADKDLLKITERNHDANVLPREGEVVITAPEATPRLDPPITKWVVYRVQHMLSNQGEIGFQSVYLKPFEG